MASKGPNDADKEKSKAVCKKVCPPRSPGPKYQLHTVVGYCGHCYSKYRYPAYTIRKRIPIPPPPCRSPGPIYNPGFPRSLAFSLGKAAKPIKIPCTSPGPIYNLPPGKSKAFSLIGRPKPTCPRWSPGPVNPPKIPPGLAFSLMRRPCPARICPGPGPGPDYTLDCVRPKAPEFSLGIKRPICIKCRSPGPKYKPCVPRKPPFYSLGGRLNNECFQPMIVECDKEWNDSCIDK